jgi:hypothetical protein
MAWRIRSFEVFWRCTPRVFADQSGYRPIGINNHKRQPAPHQKLSQDAGEADKIDLIAAISQIGLRDA